MSGGLGRRAAYAILHRHGHRTPSKPLLSEAEMWTKLLPSTSEIDAVSEHFKVLSDPSNEIPRDTASYPYGLLTKKGLQHMKDVGKSIVDKFPDLQSPSSLSIHSTNYERTQRSVQALLTGMGLLNKEIIVRSKTGCSMSMYDGNPGAAQAIFKRLQARDDFRQLLSGVSGVREKMVSAIPELANHKLGFDWFGAFDYFTCRRGHGIEIAEELKAYEAAALKHVLDRYRIYNSDDEHAAMFSIPLLSEAINSLQPPLLPGAGPALSVFSCHDTNLLGVLYALRDFGRCTGPDALVGMAEGQRGTDDSYPETISWPGFGTTIIFELVCGAASKDATVNVYYNLKPLTFLNKAVAELSVQHPDEVAHVISEDNVYIHLGDKVGVATASLLHTGISLEQCKEYISKAKDKFHCK